MVPSNQLYNQLLINNLVLSTANTNDDARLDASARSFWITGQKAFFDVRVFDSNTLWYQSKSLKQCFGVNELEKKRPIIKEF